MHNLRNYQIQFFNKKFFKELYKIKYNFAQCSSIQEWSSYLYDQKYKGRLEKNVWKELNTMLNLKCWNLNFETDVVDLISTQSG